MDGATLAAAMGRSIAQPNYDAYAAPFTEAMQAAQCTTVPRAAMWCAQLGHESLGLLYLEELASGQAYEGRRDLGNTQPGDGRLYKGRGPIQLTGRANYGAFSRWACGRGLVGSVDEFVRNPLLLMHPRWGFLAATWYWTVARTRLNEYADRGDIVAATKAINGGTNGLADRRARYERCLGLGDRLLAGCAPAAGAVVQAGPLADLLTAAAPPAPAGDSALGEGDTGQAVIELQRFLNRAFPSYSRIDTSAGRYGPQTVAVVREFQRRSGITGPDADGTRIGPRTLAALRDCGYRP